MSSGAHNISPCLKVCPKMQKKSAQKNYQIKTEIPPVSVCVKVSQTRRWLAPTTEDVVFKTEPDLKLKK